MQQSLPDALVDRIVNEIYPPTVRSSKFGNELTSLMAKGVGLFIYRVSLHLALVAKGLVIAAFKEDGDLEPELRKAKYAIFPTPYLDGCADRFSIAVNFNGVPVDSSSWALRRNI